MFSWLSGFVDVDTAWSFEPLWHWIPPTSQAAEPRLEKRSVRRTGCIPGIVQGYRTYASLQELTNVQGNSSRAQWRDNFRGSERAATHKVPPLDHDSRRPNFPDFPDLGRPPLAGITFIPSKAPLWPVQSICSEIGPSFPNPQPRGLHPSCEPTSRASGA